MKVYSWFGMIIIASIVVAGCSSASSVIGGLVVMRTEKEAHINLGSDDGIQVGDTLTVFRSEPTAPGIRNVRVGFVKVTKLMDGNYSAVEVLTGTLYERDIVEKRNR